MKILKIFIIMLFLLSFSNLKSNEKSDELKNKILKNIRCLICQGQSVYDSESNTDCPWQIKQRIFFNI